MAGRAFRKKFPSDAKRGDLGRRRGICGPKPMSQHGRPRLSRARTRPVAAMATRSGQRARSFRFGLRMVDFILSRIRSLSAARPSHFYQGLAKRIAVLSRPASRSGRFIKADGSFIKAGQPMAVLSTMAALSRLRTRPHWPLYQSEAAKSPDLLDLGCGWPISASGSSSFKQAAALLLEVVLLGFRLSLYSTLRPSFPFFTVSKVQWLLQ